VRFPIPNYLDILASDIRVQGAGDLIYALVKQKKLSINEIARKTGVSYRVCFRYLKENRAMPLGVLRTIVRTVANNEQSYELIMDRIYKQKLVFKTFASNSNEVILPKYYDERFCYLLGILHDGTVYADERINQFVLQFWQKTGKSLMKVAADYIESVFGTRPHEYDEYIQLSSKVIVDFFRAGFKIPQRQEEWSTFLIKELPWRLQKYQIAGFYDAEGWCGGKNDPRIKFSQKNPQKLNEIKILLEKRSIKCGEIVQERMINALYISNLDACVKFAKEIARVSCHPEKRAKLVELLKYVGRPPLIRGT
jgi:hypothetical protein